VCLLTGEILTIGPTAIVTEAIVDTFIYGYRYFFF
jgi:hypothetical protein